MTGLDHQSTEQIAVASNWLADVLHVAPRPLVRLLQRSFGLSPEDAILAVADAKRLRESAPK